MSEKATTSSPRNRRWRRALFAVSVIMVSVWWCGGVSYWFRMQATNALAKQDVDAAEWFVVSAIRIGPQNIDDYLLLARVQRKKGEVDSFERTLETAMAKGADARSVETERLLAQAQSGQLDNIQGRLDRLLVTGKWMEGL